MNTLTRLIPAFLILGLSTAAMAQHATHPDHNHPRPAHKHDDDDDAHSKHHQQTTPDPNCPQPQTIAQHPTIGEPLKAFTLPLNSGKTFSLADNLRTKDKPGKITVLTFWCSTCGSCRVVEHDFDSKADHYKSKGVQYLMVASNDGETAARITRFLAENKLAFPVLLDSDANLARYFGAALTTTTAVIDTHGRLRYYGSLAKSEEAIKSLLANQEVATPESTPDGCAILPKPLPAEHAREQSQTKPQNR